MVLLNVYSDYKKSCYTSDRGRLNEESYCLSLVLHRGLKFESFSSWEIYCDEATGNLFRTGEHPGFSSWNWRFLVPTHIVRGWFKTCVILNVKCGSDSNVEVVKSVLCKNSANSMF